MHKFTILEKLNNLSKNAKADDSNFHVSSIIFDSDGNEFSGVNVEYIIPSNSICAERNAISTGITKGMKIGNLTEVHILGKNINSINKELFTAPCGLCRQAIFEASNGKCKIFLYNLNNDIKEYTIKELLPLAFSGKEINGRK